MPSNEHYVDEYLDDGLPVCTGMNSKHWEADFFQQLGQEEHVSDDDELCNEMDIDTHTLKITNYKDAIESLDNVLTISGKQGTCTRGIACRLNS